MKKIKIYESALQIRPAIVLGREAKVIKISDVEAAEFRWFHIGFEPLLEKYGHANRLRLGEVYRGYAVVCYTYHNEVVYMNGALSQVPPVNANWIYDLAMRSSCAEGYLYSCESALNGARGLGAFNYVWSFNGCTFESWAQNLIDKKYLSGNAKEIDSSLKKKLTEALAFSSTLEVELTDEEYTVLKTYAPDYFRKFFAEI